MAWRQYTHSKHKRTNHPATQYDVPKDMDPRVGIYSYYLSNTCHRQDVTTCETDCTQTQNCVTILRIWCSWDHALWYISIVKPTRCTIFEFIEYHFTCFGQSFRPSSGVLDCTYSIMYMSHRFVDCMLACPLAWVNEPVWHTRYTWHCVYSPELLMMDGKTVRNI